MKVTLLLTIIIIIGLFFLGCHLFYSEVYTDGYQSSYHDEKVKIKAIQEEYNNTYKDYARVTTKIKEMQDRIDEINRKIGG